MSNKQDTVFEELFDAHSDVIYRLCFFKTGDSDVAKDLTQDVFTKLYLYLQTHKTPRNPKGFIYQMARNRIIDHYRKHTTDSLDSLLENGQQFQEQELGASHIYVKLEYKLALEALGKLEKTYQDVLYLQLVEGKSISEIADLVGISNSNVSVRLNRGKKQLRELLEPTAL